MALYLLQLGEIDYFAGVERDQTTFFAEVQADLLQEQKDTARSTVVAGYDSGQASLARYYSLVLIFIGSMVGLVLSGSLLLLLVFSGLAKFFGRSLLA